MEQKKRIQMKILLIILLALMLFFLFMINYREHSQTEPSGEMVRSEGAMILIHELADRLGEQEDTLWEKLPSDTTREDWYNAFDQLLTYYQVEGEIHREQIASFDMYIRENELLAIRNAPKERVCMENVYIEESGEEGITFFYRNHSLFVPKPLLSFSDGIADIVFEEGVLSEILPKEEMVCGKILQVTPEKVVLEGLGTYEIAENCEGYQTYETLRNAALSELAVGYEFTDFVIDENQICGFLVAHKEEMQLVRIALHNSSFGSLYHQEVGVCSEQELLVTYVTEDGEEQECLQPGENVCFSAEKDFSECIRVKVEGKVNTGKIQLWNVERNQGIPSYRGRIEIFPEEQGLVVINEIPLEEYLYAVVPSEMPASYPEESLKAQAVCARTYAYGYLEKAGLPELGAHMDDSVNYQVYNNILEKAASTNAVRETTGEMLFYGENLVNTYYYSTSCGFGTNAEIWMSGSELPYLKSIHIARSNEESLTDMTREEAFREYLAKSHEEDYECSQPWYRWNYEVKELDVELLCQRIRERIPEAPAFRKIQDISEGRRNDGGILTQLFLETDKGEVVLEGEYNIRYALNLGGTVIRQDGSEYPLSGILPSAYFYIVPIKEKGEVTGLSLIGGGFGHGVGMSQNGAGQMAKEGKNYQEILNLFYPECELAKMY